jgi:hypothetical protein
MNPFFGNGKRRAIVGEIRKTLQDLTGTTPVYGFAQMLKPGDALVNTDRISGFAETWDRQEKRKLQIRLTTASIAINGPADGDPI